MRKLNQAQVTLIGIAGNAPSYSVAVTSVALVAAVGTGAPLALLLCAVVTLGIVFAYARLNREQPHAGAAYAWVGTILHPVAGFFAGWCVMVSALIFMISALLPAGNATLTIFAPQYVNDKAWVVTSAVIWLVVVTAVVARGTELLGRVQSTLTVLEIGLLIALAAAVLAAADSYDFRVLWGAFSLETWTLAAIAKSLVIAIFFFWGWDVIFNLAEETTATRTTSGPAGLIALLILTLIFVFFAAVVAATLSSTELQAAGNNALLALADKFLPPPLSSIAVLSFLLSVIGGMEACIVSFSRTALAEARDRRLWSGFSRLRAGSETPALASIVASIIVLLLLLASAALETVEAMVNASISATAIIVAAYYGMAAIACAVFFRRKRESHPASLALYVIWPLVSAGIVFAAGFIALFEMDALTVVTVAGVMGLGLCVLFVHRNAIHPHGNAERIRTDP